MRVCAQLCPTLCDPLDCSPPGSSVHGISQARILEWVAVPPPGDLPNSEIKFVFASEPPGKPTVIENSDKVIDRET